jgi:hypothetical protein
MSQSQAATAGISAPKSEPQVPGPGLRRPTPSAVASASAKRGLLAAVTASGVALLFVVMVFVEIEEDRPAFAFDQFLFVENGFGNDVFLASPVAQVAIPAAFAAKRKIRVHCGVRLSLANRAFVLHSRFRRHFERSEKPLFDSGLDRYDSSLSRSVPASLE